MPVGELTQPALTCGGSVVVCHDTEAHRVSERVQNASTSYSKARYVRRPSTSPPD